MVLLWLRNHSRLRVFRILGCGWRWFANINALLTISMGLAYFVVWGASPNAPVFERQGPVQVVTPVVKLDAQMAYIVHTRQNEKCPGDIVSTFTLVPPEKETTSAVITIRRPITRPDVGTFRNFPVSISLPTGIYPGKWRVNIAADSTCPLRHVVSQIATFEIEVVP
jgi:hypothetical protein